MHRYLLLTLIFTILTGCNSDKSANNTSSQDNNQTESFVAVLPDTQSHVHNPEAVIPPQCYTKTEGEFNPCYTCHQNHPFGSRPNRMGDGGLQGDYNFSEIGVHNRWHNLFVDRSAQVAAINDQAVLNYINQDNYTPLASRLKQQGWQGYLPDLKDLHLAADAFESDGFSKDGSGWVAFNYKPLPSTFWPTNGSTDDVFIRLPEAFRNDAFGHFNKKIYQANLAILEATIKDLATISTPPLDENLIGRDLNDDGVLDTIESINQSSHFVGAASHIEAVPFLYPEGTEFLHTVRYVGVNDAGDIFVPQRLKELRYMRKIRFFSAAKIASLYGNEHQEKMDGNLPRYPNAGDWGLDNKFGWQISGFIENANGELRVQNHEENFFCMGCHTSIGATIDQTFAFPRKITGAEGWGYINLKGMKDVPAVGDDQGEILRYLQRVGGGDEFRQNQEMITRYFNSDGSVKEDVVNSLDVYQLITPSRERALQLNKAYWSIVKEQSFAHGRDATILPARNVLQEVDPDKQQPLPNVKHVNGEIRLQW